MWLKNYVNEQSLNFKHHLNTHKRSLSTFRVFLEIHVVTKNLQIILELEADSYIENCQKNSKKVVEQTYAHLQNTTVKV